MKILLVIGTFVLLSGCASVRRMAPDQANALSAQELVTLGDTYLLRGEKKAAIAQYEMAVKQDPRHVQALVSLGNLAYEAKEWNKARAYFKRARKVNPTDPVILNNLAMVDLAQGKSMKRAKRELELALPTAGRAAPYLEDTLAKIASSNLE